MCTVNMIVTVGVLADLPQLPVIVRTLTSLSSCGMPPYTTSGPSSKLQDSLILLSVHIDSAYRSIV